MTRFNPNRCRQGFDGLNFECLLDVADESILNTPAEEMANQNKKTIVRIQCDGGKVKVYINPAYAIRQDNTIPFGLADIGQLKAVRLGIIKFLQTYLDTYLPDNDSNEIIQNLKVRSLECNLTMPCEEGAEVSDLIHLFDMVFEQTYVFRSRKPYTTCDKYNTGCKYKKPKQYALKAYNKSLEQFQRGNVYVEKNMLRLELIFKDRLLKRAFGKNQSIEDVLTKQGLTSVCREYRRILIEDILGAHVRPYLKAATNILVESLIGSDSGHMIAETIARHKITIVDIEVLRKALERYYKRMRYDDDNIDSNVTSNIHLYRKKRIGLPEGVLKTLKVFHQATG